MLTVFAKLFPDIPYIPLLYPNLGPQQTNMLFVEKAFEDLREPFVELVEDPAKADYLLIPHNFSSVRDRGGYLADYARLSHQHDLEIIVFAHGDSDAPILLPNARIFRTSQYGYKKKENEIMMPAYTEDLLEGRTLELRNHGEKPIIGFCGWADYKNFQNRVGTMLKNAAIHVRSKRDPKLSVHTKGLTLRRRALETLERSPAVATNLCIRKSHSAHAKTITMDPVQARREYIENLTNSDLALCIKGDGNYSLRFYEALSLGRMPLFLDTDCVLPLEDVIRYDDFIIRVPFQDLRRIDEVVAEKWQSLDTARFHDMQKKAREAFEKYLSVKSFLGYAVGKLL
jgi:hypothetical protein